ncbi:unnamed protein product [Closterium sp. NIES-64]|nr:unnamed protein product [Closterium sp. NIES-64]
MRPGVRGEGRLERSATAGAALIDSPLTLFVPHDTCDHACVQVCEERDALEDLLLQEQLKNGTPAVSPSSCHPTTYTSFRFDKQVEEARAQAAALEMELQAMASRCEEWKRRAGERALDLGAALDMEWKRSAGERAAEMNTALEQSSFDTGVEAEGGGAGSGNEPGALEEGLEELDDSSFPPSTPPPPPPPLLPPTPVRVDELKRRAGERAAEMNPVLVQALLEELDDSDSPPPSTPPSPPPPPPPTLTTPSPYRGCTDEWKRRAGERAAEMNPVLVQALLEERLEELDDSGVLALQVECARLRDELAKSEVLRFELYRSLEQGAGGRRVWCMLRRGQTCLVHVAQGADVSGACCAGGRRVWCMLRRGQTCLVHVAQGGCREVLRFELYRSLEQGAACVLLPSTNALIPALTALSPLPSSPPGPSYPELPPRSPSGSGEPMECDESLVQELLELGQASTELHSPLSASPCSPLRHIRWSMECDESVVQELLELGQASLTQEDVTRLMETVEAAERRAEKAEREAEQRAVQVQLLEAKMAAMLNSCPMDEHKRSPSLVSSSPISFRLSPVASSSSPDPASLTRSSSSSATSQHSQQQQQQALFQEQQAGRQNQDEREQSPQLSGRGDRVAGVEGELNGAALGSKFTGRGTAEGGVVAAARKGGDLTHEAVVRRGALGVVVDRNPRTKPEEEQEQLEVEEREEEGEDGVEELRQMVHRVQRQNRITHVLLSVVIAVSIPPLVALVRGWFGGWGRRYEPKRPGAGPAPKQVARVAIRSK